MPEEIKKAFIKEYGKKEGTRIFYAWENKHKKDKKRKAMQKPSRNKPEKFNLKESLDHASREWWK